MATRNDDDEEGGSRLWRGMRALIFGEDHDATLRDKLEDAIDEADAAAPSGRPVAARAPDAAQFAPLRRPHRGQIAVTRATSSRSPLDQLDDLYQLRDAGHSRLP